MGNIKESVIPYAKKHFKLAQLSFDRYGALSPTENKQGSETSDSNIIEDIKKLDGDTKREEQEKGNGTTSNNELENKSPSRRTFSQVECESSAPPVSVNKLNTI